GTDGGRPFKALERTAADVQSFSAAAGSGSLQLAEGHTSTGVVDLTLDAGRTWRTLYFPAQKASNVAVAPVVPVVVAYDDQHLTIEQVPPPSTCHLSGTTGYCTATVTTVVPLTPGIGTPADNSVQLTAPTAGGLYISGVS